MDADVKPVQRLKALAPIDLTESGMVIVVKPVQAQKAWSLIFVIELGKTTDFKPEQ